MGLARKVVPGPGSNTLTARRGLPALPVWAGSRSTLIIHITCMMCPWGYARSNILVSVLLEIFPAAFLKLCNSLFSVPWSNGVVGPGHSRNQDTKRCWASKSSPGFENLFQCLYYGVIHVQSWQAWVSYGSVTVHPIHTPDFCTRTTSTHTWTLLLPLVPYKCTFASSGQAQLLLAILLTTQHLCPCYHCLPRARSFFLPLEEHIQRCHKVQPLDAAGGCFQLGLDPYMALYSVRGTTTLMYLVWETYFKSYSNPSGEKKSTFLEILVLVSASSPLTLWWQLAALSLCRFSHIRCHSWVTQMDHQVHQIKFYQQNCSLPISYFT